MIGGRKNKREQVGGPGEEASGKIFILLVLACCLLVFMHLFIVGAQVQGRSMEPSLSQGDIVLCSRLAGYRKVFAYNDIIIFKEKAPGDSLLVKRVIGLPGDQLVISQGQIYRNGSLVQEDFLGPVTTQGELSVFIPQDHLFVMGDNRENSWDSRYESIGLIPYGNIRGTLRLNISRIIKRKTI